MSAGGSDKRGAKSASEAAAIIGEGIQAFTVPGSVAEDRKVGLGHGNLGARLLSEDTTCFAFPFVTGGEFNCGFSYANDNATVLYVFEAPIDLMSFLTLHRHKPWHRASYLSLGGLSEDPLRRFLKEHKSIQRIAFCFDNDINKPENRGQEAAKRFMRQFSGKYITSILCPCKKDWNDVLRDKIQKGEFL